jgi:hypothetical protein
MGRNASQKVSVLLTAEIGCYAVAGGQSIPAGLRIRTPKGLVGPCGRIPIPLAQAG